MLHDLIDIGTDRLEGFDTQPASLFPWLTAHPTNFAEHVAVAPPIYIGINGENSVERTVHDDLEVKRLHGDGSENEISKAKLSQAPSKV
jgi:hypothetical protein